VTFDDVLMDLIVEDPVNAIENLGLRYPRISAQNQAFEDSSFAAGQRQNLTVDEWIAPIEEDPDARNVDALLGHLHAAPDGTAARQDLSDVEWLCQHIIEAKREEIERLSKSLRLDQADKGCPAARPNPRRNLTAILNRAQEETLDDGNIRIADEFKPFLELRGLDGNCGDALALETSNTPARHQRAVVQDNKHQFPPSPASHLLSQMKYRDSRSLLTIIS
jgi:hypothetical protein